MSVDLVICLPLSRAAWQTEAFQQTLKTELQTLTAGALPLEHGTQSAGLVDDSDIAVTVLRYSVTAEHLLVVVGVFFSEIVSGCSCGDEPTMSENAYCELQLLIDPESAETRCVAV
ncbi:MAG: glucosamine--fructose-6-phosphate aminotransferase [Gammaproteobacteria bacterium]|nr:glucosamine--fructose-6-phosphate aminotransferase [Gammaproteobacteria bacterium]